MADYHFWLFVMMGFLQSDFNLNDVFHWLILTIHWFYTLAYNLWYFPKFRPPFCCSSVAQSFPALCDPMDCSTPRFSLLTVPQSLFKLMSIKSVLPSNHLILCRLIFSCLQSFLASGSFPTNRLFALGSQSIGPSASALPVNIQGWCPLGLTGLISL